MMKAGQLAYELIKEYEGLSLTAYLCPAGKWSIGYGHTGPGVYVGLEITRPQALALLEQDILKAERVINRYGLTLSQHQFDALVSFVYNLGPANFAMSTLLKRLRAGKHKEAADQFSRWIHVNKVPVPGLIKRRAAERSVFLGGTSDQAS